MLGDDFDRVDAALAGLEGQVELPAPDGVRDLIDAAIGVVAQTLRAWLAAQGHPGLPPDADVLEVWKALVKGDPTWNAIRDNCRELVYYRNCLALGRADALPPLAHRMAVRTARHVFLYVRTRAVRAGLLER